MTIGCGRRLGLALTLAIAAGTAGAIVSERHLRGVKALDCELEAARAADPAARFRLAVNTRERTLRLETSGAAFPYEDVSDTTMRFELTLPATSALVCELEMPAGALSCAPRTTTAQPRLGVCLPRQ